MVEECLLGVDVCGGGLKALLISEHKYISIMRSCGYRCSGYTGILGNVCVCV